MRNARVDFRGVPSSDTLEDRHRTASDFQPPDIERNRQEGSAQGIDDVACREKTAVAAPIDERLAIVRIQRLQNHLRLVPPIGARSCRYCEQHVPAVGQHLRTMRDFALLDAYQCLWFTAGRRHSHDAFTALAEQDLASVPGDPQRALGRADGHGRAPVDGHPLDCAIFGHPEGDRSAVG